MKKIDNDLLNGLRQRSVLNKDSMFGKWKKVLKAGLLLSLGIATGEVNAQVSVTSSGGTTTPTPYTTLNAAFTAINAGIHQGTIAIAITGNTTEPATPVPLLASAGTSNYTSINIKPSGGNFIINSDPAPAANRGIIELAGADNVTIDGDDPLTPGTQNLSIVAATVSTSGVACIRLSSNSTTGADGANNNTVQNCIITGSRSSATSTTTNYGIQFSNGTSTSSSSTGAYSSLNTIIRNNLITRCYYGIHAIGNSATYLNTGTQITGNTIGSATAVNYVAFRGIDISYSATAAGTGSALIEFNDVRTGHTSGSASMSAIEVAAVNAGIKITRNNIHDCINPTSSVWGMYGIGITSPTSNTGITITNNFIRDIAGYAVTSLGSQYGGSGIYVGADATGIVINNNTIAQLASGVIGNCILVNSSGATISQCLNNIMVNNVSNTNSCCFYVVNNANISAGNVNNNDYFISSVGTLGYYGSARATLLNWQNATTKDAASISENPSFTSATDLHIPAGTITFLESGGASTAITGVTTDFDNQTRPGPSSYGFGTAPDIGADEFDGRIVYTCTTPAPGSTISSANNLCYGTSITLSMANATAGSGITYQWQVSPDNITFYDSVGAITPTYTITPTASAYFRCKVTCANGPASTFSTPVQITFANSITSTTAGQRCGVGTISLAATGNTGTTLKWYAAATGGVTLGVGSPFTTPVINATTPYYVGAETVAPGSINVGAGATTSNTYPNPFYSNWSNTHNQYLIPAVELLAAGLSAGNITGLAINITSGTTTLNDFSVKMGPTNATDMSAYLSPTFTPVYAAATLSPVVGLNTITFTTPFSWDGTSNVVIEICHGNSASTATISSTATADNTSYLSTIHVNKTTATAGAVTCADVATNLTTYSIRPKFTFLGQVACSSPRIAVAATVNTPPAFTITPNQAICNGAVTPLSVTSNTANFNTYTWSPVTNLYTDPAATTAYVAGSSATTVYLKSTTPATTVYTANANNTTTLCAAVTTDTMTILPAAVTATTSAATLCLSGTVTLTLNPAAGYGPANIKWQSGTDNINFVDVTTGGTGTTYTPTVNATTYYRAAIKNSAGALCVNSTSATIVVNNPVLTGTTPGSRCGIGTVTLAATANTGSVLRWYAAATGGAPLATGTTFTTPVISANSTYYVGAEVGQNINAAVGTATTLTDPTSQPTAFCNRWKQYWCQMVYTAAELSAAGLVAGNISSITFNTTTIGDAANVTNFTVALGTAPSTLTAFTTTGLATVYGPSTYSQTVGLNTITFTTPYNWDGVSNILVDLRQTGADATNNAITYFTATTNNTCATATTSNVTPVLATSNPSPTLGTQRLNIIFNQPNCSSARVAVAATVTPAPTFTITPNQTICNGAITPLTVTSSAANFNNYTWSPVTNLYTNAAATTAYVAGSNAATVYLKSTTPATTVYTANANNTTSLCAAVTTDTITIVPAAATATTSVATLCMSGTATLALTPATGYGAATFKWQSGTDNVNFVDVTTGGTATTYTTPTLNATTYYRATIKNSAGALCLNSTSATIVVNNPTITGTTPGSRCGTGTVTLAAAANTGSTPVWYAAQNGGGPLATGNTYTTPSIAANTNYWVAARSAGYGNAATATIGTGTTLTGTTEELTAFCNRRASYQMQMIFTAAELNAAGIFGGNITSVGFNISTIGDAATNSGYTVKMGTTSQSTCTSTYISGLTPVYGPSTYTHAVGQNTITFTTPFPWDGTSNVVIEVTHNGIDALYNATTYYTATTNNMVGYSYNGSTTASTSTERFNTTFGYAPYCESPRQQVTATVNAAPTAGVTPSGTVQICTGSSTTLTGSGGGTYQWRNASGNIGGQTANTFTTGTAGTYRVVVTAANNCTDTSAPVVVTTNPIPSVFLGNDTTFCSGNTLTLNAGNTGATYLWNNGSTNQTRAVTTSGTYSVKVTNSAGCFKSDTILVTVNPTPVVNLGNDTNLCLGINYVLNAGNPAASYLWDNNTTGQTRTINTSGTYSVRVTNSFNCVARDTVVTTFLPAPVVNLGNDIGVCAGSTVTLDAGNPGETYLWDNNTTQQTRTVNTSGTYYVTVRNIANCKGSDTVNVIVHPLPVVNLGNDTTFCHGNTLTLNAGNPGASYHWNDNSTGQTLNASSTGNYSVVVTDQYSCVGTDNINILVKDLPSGVINAVHGDIATYTFNVLNQQYVTGYTWNFGDGSPLVHGAMVQHTYANNGIYTVTVTLAGECSDSVAKSRTVDVYDATGGTGIAPIGDSKALILYPNPAKDIVTLENKHNLKMKQITVYNVVGQVISNTPADSGDKHILHTATYVPGIYTIRIETDKGTVIRKFEIMK